MKVTFSKFNRPQFKADPAELDVYVDGVRVGSIEQSLSDLSGPTERTGTRVEVDAYLVEIYSEDLGIDLSECEERAQGESALSTLARAKAIVRRAVQAAQEAAQDAQHTADLVASGDACIHCRGVGCGRCGNYGSESHAQNSGNTRSERPDFAPFRLQSVGEDGGFTTTTEPVEEPHVLPPGEYEVQRFDDETGEEAVARYARSYNAFIKACMEAGESFDDALAQWCRGRNRVPRDLPDVESQRLSYSHVKYCESKGLDLAMECEDCGLELSPKRAHWLELTSSTGFYHEVGSAPAPSQGCFMFCDEHKRERLQARDAAEQAKGYTPAALNYLAVLHATGSAPKGAHLDTVLAVVGFEEMVKRYDTPFPETDPDFKPPRFDYVLTDIAPRLAVEATPFYKAAKLLLEEGFEPRDRRPRVGYVYFETEEETACVHRDGSVNRYAKRVDRDCQYC